MRLVAAEAVHSNDQGCSNGDSALVPAFLILFRFECVQSDTGSRSLEWEFLCSKLCFKLECLIDGCVL